MSTKILSAIFLLTGVSVFNACTGEKNKADAYGNFEATEVIIASEASGKILSLSPAEGEQVKQNDLLGQVDSLQLVLKRDQLDAAHSGIGSKTKSIVAQINVLKQQRENLIVEKNRVEKLLKDKAATGKQLDDINAQLKLIDEQIKSIEVQNEPVLSELKSNESQFAQLNDQISKCKIKSPINGTVLARYAEPGELTGAGKPLLKIADLSTMILRVFITGEQLTGIKLAQKLKVKVDAADKKEKEFDGEVMWISPVAEFTPKTIQTKEERVNMVYAVKVKVKNDGTLRIGMPGEIRIK